MTGEDYLYAETDDPLFTDAHPRHDDRSVGEMLLDVDHAARELLMDVVAEDAGPMLRAWPDTVAAAERLWSAFPHPVSIHTGLDGPIERLSTYSAGIRLSLARSGDGLAQGPTDARMTNMANTLDLAAELVHGFGPSSVQTVDHHDLEAARSRVIHSLYVTAHAVGVALHLEGRNLFHEAVAQGQPLAAGVVHSPYAVAPVARWMGRVAACEAAAGRYFTGHHAPSTHGQVLTAEHDPNRIAQALARWDTQAHRSLADRPQPVDILLAARTQALLSGAGVVLSEAATRAGLGQDMRRTQAAMSESGRSWGHLAGRWQELVVPGTRPAPKLLAAAAEIRAAYRLLTHDGTTMAKVADIANRPGLEHAVNATFGALETGADVAHLVAEQADRSDLVGHARLLAQRCRRDIETGHALPEHDQEDIAWVAPDDIVAKRLVPIPPPAAAGLCVASRIMVTKAEQAAGSLATHLVETAVAEPVPGRRPARRHDRDMRSPAPAKSLAPRR